jgi:hypothetical protein
MSGAFDLVQRRRCGGELRGLEWSDHAGTSLTVNRSIWRSVVNLPKTRASRGSVPVILQLAIILDEYRRSMGDPQAGVISIPESPSASVSFQPASGLWKLASSTYENLPGANGRPFQV